MKEGDDVVDVKVDESEVNVVVEEEEKEVVVVESIFVVVSMRKLRGGRDTNLCQLSWTSCTSASCLNCGVNQEDWNARSVLQPGCKRPAAR